MPSLFGQSVLQLHDRCAYALAYIISNADAEDAASFRGHGIETAILICTHAASMIAIGRNLTGNMPRDVCEDDFKTYTCGISKFVRKEITLDEGAVVRWETGTETPKVDWQGAKGVAGGWECVANGDCGHLPGGEERGWLVSPTFSCLRFLI